MPSTSSLSIPTVARDTSAAPIASDSEVAARGGVQPVVAVAVLDGALRLSALSYAFT
jgi:hypothetical protein